MKQRCIDKFFKPFVLVFTMIFFMCTCTACNDKYSYHGDLKERIAFMIRVGEMLDLKHMLSINENGEFTMLFLSDVQFNTPDIDKKTLDDIETVVKRERPDLVIFNGDNSTGITDKDDLKKYITNMTMYLEENKIPWAHVYGNHDAEGNNVSKVEQQEIYESFEYCISMSGDENLFGIGNFLIPVLDYEREKIVFNVWCFDSGTARVPYEAYKDGRKILEDNAFYAHYEPMQQNQVDWFCETSKFLEGYYGEQIPGVMAFHIPLQETYYAWSKKDEIGLEWTGEKRENISAHAQDVPLFEAAKENNILAIVNSHDHINDFMVKYEGIRLCYTACIGTHEYYAEDMLGGRVVKFNTKNPNDVQTYMSYVNERS